MTRCAVPTVVLLLVLCPAPVHSADESSRLVHTPYTAQQVVFDFYFDDPAKIGPALYWIRSLVNPMTESPYDLPIEAHDLKVIIHGTEVVTVAKKNYEKYRDAVERMRYYAEFGVKFMVCALAAHDFGYTEKDFHEFVEVVPSAITELAHWQLKGYALITPQVMEKRFSVEELR